MPIRRAKTSTLKSGNIALIGMPFDDHSSFLKGPAKAPPLIIEALESESANYFTEDLMDLANHPDVCWLGNATLKDYFDIEFIIAEILKRGAIPFSMGGDHSITYPILRAMAASYPTLSILHFDAHGDLYDSLGGNRYSHASPFARIMEEGLAQALTQVGIRTLNDHQRTQVSKFGVKVIDMRNWSPDIDLNLSGPVYLSFDMDVLDPAFAPGVSHHEPGGFTTREVLGMIQKLDLNIVGLDLVEYNPDRDLKGVTAMTAAKIVKELLAKLL
ncbi:agmatinase [Cyclobacteriaceae bacterium]|jgi:arginase|nr:agmatinase [Cyclobacteriaceae bacterium]|tara:strand:- start:5563 stop:6378 length:816 start_codon:yes stop_codon:yes gene_type:complete